MKLYRLYALVFFALILGCSDDNSTIVENGTNKGPNLKPTGSSANDFLSADQYASLVVEVFYVENFRPNAQTLINLRNFMANRLNKPGNITITEKQIPSPGKSPYDINEVVQIETENRTAYNESGILKLYILFLDGRFSTDTNNTFTLGTAYRNTSFVIYENSIQTLSNSAVGINRTSLETTVVLHEFCHLLGLVDFGSPMQTEHLDEAHGQHCDNEDCLMYWQTENNGVLGMMSAGNIPQLDANCLSDLRNNGGK